MKKTKALFCSMHPNNALNRLICEVQYKMFAYLNNNAYLAGKKLKHMKIKVEIEIALKKLPKNEPLYVECLEQCTFDDLKNEVHGVIDEMISPKYFFDNISMYEHMDDIIDYEKSKISIKELKK